MNNLTKIENIFLIDLLKEKMKDNSKLFNNGELSFEELHNYQYVLIHIIEKLKLNI